MLSNEKMCVLPKLSLMPHTLTDMNEACKHCPEGAHSNGLHDMWVFIQVTPEECLFLLKPHYLAPTLATSMPVLLPFLLISKGYYFSFFSVNAILILSTLLLSYLTDV